MLCWLVLRTITNSRPTYTMRIIQVYRQWLQPKWWWCIAWHGTVHVRGIATTYGVTLALYFLACGTAGVQHSTTALSRYKLTVLHRAQYESQITRTRVPRIKVVSLLLTLHRGVSKHPYPTTRHEWQVRWHQSIHVLHRIHFKVHTHNCAPFNTCLFPTYLLRCRDPRAAPGTSPMGKPSGNSTLDNKSRTWS